MVAALPPTARLKLEQTLDAWREWQCDPPLRERPRIVGELTGGYSNYSVLVEAGQSFVVRIHRISPERHFLDRSREFQALRNASVAGIAPAPRYWHRDLATLVCDYLRESQASAGIGDVARLLRHIHALPARGPALDVAGRIAEYEVRCRRHSRQPAAPWRELRAAAAATLARTPQSRDDLVFCHNDLLTSNRLCHDDRLWAIDWEYAAVNNRFFDLAAVAAGDNLSHNQSQELLYTYRGETPSERDWRQFRGFQCVYRYLEYLWFLDVQPEVATDEKRTQKVRQLLAAFEDTGDGDG